ncbi:elongation factor 1-beta [Geoglobus acetivorans]|uniref:Elongation factor 1-beta n=1 Tax=Geoglobus acetivorans TaxID=565033 RepID=A0A0A7GF13_GEOAI|nr:Translation elongation factor 1 beta subunit [Geoglobus acetivorans]
MGRVFMKLRVMPKGVEVDLEQLKEKVSQAKPDEVEITDFGIQPIAFGLKALIVVVVMPDTEGIGDRLIESIQGIDDVESVEIEVQELV